MIIFSASCASAAEKPPCPPGTFERDKVVQVMKDQHKETTKFFGLANTDGKKVFMEVLISPTGQWTIIVTGTKGCSIPLANGTNWQKRILVTEKGEI